jgi:gamma-glutamyltranspeptidase/glutathione hydrolase
LRLAADGFSVSENLAASFEGAWPQLGLFPSTMKAFSRGGLPYQSGDTLRQPDLASTLRAVIAEGREGFYTGSVAASIVQESGRHGGIIAADDLRNYRAVERAPLTGTYRGFAIITAPPPSSGGVLLLQILNFLEQSDLRAMGWNSSPALHVFASACQRAFADRMAYLGDPDFVSIPVNQLTSKKYAAGRRRGWDSLRAESSSRLSPGSSREFRETTHYCVADRWGNVVSVTVTLNDLFGCKTVVDGGGFFLNNEMDDFAVKTGSSNTYGLVGGQPNLIAPGKRMLSSMTPTVVLKDGEPVLLVGARGGSRIPSTTAQIISNVIDFGMDVQEAVDAPRVHHQWVPDTLLYDQKGLAADVLRNLGSMGYALQEVNWTARAEALAVDPKSRLKTGGPDPRERGVALGY